MFRFTRFALYNEHSAHKIGTDSVLLGSWLGARLHSDRPFRAADLGSGTGVLGCLIADRFPLASIDLFEKEPEACEEFKRSAEQLPFKERMQLFEGDIFEQLPLRKPEKGYDFIATNPPFFLKSLAPEDLKRKTSRHFEGESMRKRWFELAASALAPGGTLAFVEPADREPPSGFSRWNLFESRVLWVKGLEGKPRIRKLQEWIRPNGSISNTGLEELEIAVWKAPNLHSNAYKNLLNGILPSLSESSAALGSDTPN